MVKVELNKTYILLHYGRNIGLWTVVEISGLGILMQDEERNLMLVQRNSSIIQIVEF